MNITHSRGSKKRFIPGNSESAKEFLRASVEGISRSRVSSPGTPVTSRPNKLGMAVCHGCHGPMGGGAHQGSAPGKGVCSHPHSILCKGGIVENLSWAPCPPDYVYDPNIVLANGTGFDSTLHTFNFQPGGQNLGQSSSTPGNINTTTQQVLPPQPPPLPGQHVFTEGGTQTSSAAGSSTVARYPGVSGDRRQLEREFPNTTTTSQALPPTNLGEIMPEGMQSNIDYHRAANQVTTLATSGPSGMANITDLRNNPQLRSSVETIVDQIRTNIPALSAARSAQPGTQATGSSVPPPQTGTLPEITNTVISSAPISSIPTWVYHPLSSNPVNTAQLRVPQPTQGLVGGLQQQQAAQSVLHQGTVSQTGAVQHQVPQQGSILRFADQVIPQINGQHSQDPIIVQNNLPPTQPYPGQLPQPNPVYQHVSQQSCLGARSQQGLQQTLQQSQQPALQLQQGPQQQLGSQSSLAQGYQVAQRSQPVPAFDLTQHCYEWVTDSLGRQILVRTPLPPAQQSSSGLPSFAQQQVVTPQQYRTEFRCCPSTGRQWTVQVPVTSPATNPPVVQSTLEWRIHPHTGERYQVQVPSMATTPQQQTTQLGGTPTNLQNQQSYMANTTAVFQPDMSSQQPSATSHIDQSHNSSLLGRDRVAGIVSLVEGGGGTRRISRVLEFSKKCPTKWSKQATLATINLPLYAWGVMEEIESALSGRIESLPDSVILGKIRHLKNTLEVCCQNSGATDFTGYSWTLAKDYATKLNDEIEQGKTTWQQLPSEVKTSTLMSATMENPRPVQRSDPKKTKVDDKKDICLTFNRCMTENKCDYEVANPTKTCQRKHECSWCRSNRNQSWKHQEWKCRNKAGGASSTAS